MSYDQDTIDEYRSAAYRPEYISDDEAARRYEADEDEVVNNAIEALTTDELSDDVKVALLAWYRTTPTYDAAVRAVRDEAERP